MNDSETVAKLIEAWGRNATIVVPTRILTGLLAERDSLAAEVANLRDEIGDLQDSLVARCQERDTALAEVERLGRRVVLLEQRCILHGDTPEMLGIGESK